MENFNFFKKKEIVTGINADTSKEVGKVNINNLSTLEGKRSFIEQNGIHSFEDWSKKTFDEKLSILSKLDAIPDNFNHFEKKYENELRKKVKDDFNKNNEAVAQELDKNFDFYMKVIGYSEYKGQSESLYPEELLDIKPEELESLKKGGNDSNYLLSPLDSLKKNGIANLSEWYGKSIDEKRKILMASPDFMGVDIEVKKGKIPLTLLYGKEKYNAYLDQCFYSTIYRISEVLNLKNENDKWNNDEHLGKTRLNLEKMTDEKFKQKVAETQEILDENRKKIIIDMHNSIGKKLPDLSPEDRNEIKDYLESTHFGDDKEFKI